MRAINVFLVMLTLAPIVHGAPGDIYNLGTLPGGAHSQGWAINVLGQVTGKSEIGGNIDEHAFLYTGTPGSGGSMADLGTLGGRDSFGYAVNSSGQVAGYSYTVTADITEPRAFRYSGTPGSGGSMVDLGTLGGAYSRGYAINSWGQVAGSSNTRRNADHAFLYTGTPGLDGQMIDLDAWLDSVNPTEGSKWQLYGAHGLTDAGLITGIGAYNDGPGGLPDSGSRPFILDASSLVRPRTTHLLSVGARDEVSSHGGDISAQRVHDAFVKMSSVQAGVHDVLTLDTSSANNRSALESALNALRSDPNLKPGDTFVFYLNSHGIFDPTGDEAPVSAQDDVNDLAHRTTTTGDEHFYLQRQSSAGVLSDDDFASIFKDPKWQQINKLFIIDTCYAGGLWGSTENGDTGDLMGLNRAALIAASEEGSFSFAHLDSASGLYIGNLGSALVDALGELRDQSTFTYQELYDAIRVSGSQLYGSGLGRIQAPGDNWDAAIEMSFAIAGGSSSDFEMTISVPEPAAASAFAGVTVLFLLRRRNCRRDG